MFTERTSVGLDVHARSVVAAAIDGVTGEVFRARLTPDLEEVVGWVGGLPGPSAAVYEAGPTGFGLARAFAAAGVRCEVRGALEASAAQRRSGQDRRPGRDAAGPAAAVGRVRRGGGAFGAEEAARDLVPGP